MADTKPLNVELVAKLRGFVAGLGKATGHIRTFAGGATRALSSVAKIGGVALAGIGVGFVGAVKQAAGFQSSMAEVSTLLNATPEELARVREGILGLASAFGEDASNMARAYYQTVSAGISDTGEALALLEIAGKAAKAGVSDTFTAVDALTTILSSYGMQTKDATKVSDLLFQTVKEGKTTFGELGPSVGKVTPIAAQLGVSLEDLFAGVATLTKGGLSTSETMTALRATMISVLKPTKDAKDTAAKYGIELGAAAIKTKGLVGWLADFRDRLGDDKDAIGKIIPNVEALAAVMALTGNQFDEFVNIQKKMKGATGATETAFEKMAKTIQFKWNQAWSDFKILLGEIGDALLPTLTKFLNDDLIPALKDAQAWIKDHKEELAKWFDNLVVGVKDGFTTAVDYVKDMIADIQAEMDKGKGLLEATATIIGRAVGEALVGGVWEGIKEGLRHLGKWFSHAVIDALPSLTPAGRQLLHDLVTEVQTMPGEEEPSPERKAELRGAEAEVRRRGKAGAPAPAPTKAGVGWFPWQRERPQVQTIRSPVDVAWDKTTRQYDADMVKSLGNITAVGSDEVGVLKRIENLQKQAVDEARWMRYLLSRQVRESRGLNPITYEKFLQRELIPSLENAAQKGLLNLARR